MSDRERECIAWDGAELWASAMCYVLRAMGYVLWAMCCGLCAMLWDMDEP